MNILVTGAHGQLGQEIQQAVRLQGSRHTYYFCDRDELDITDAQALQSFLTTHSIDLLINAAAYTAVDRAEQEPDLAEAINHRAVADMARLAKERGAFLIHISTDYVFSGDACTPYMEDAPTSPLGVYGKTKRLGEEAIEASEVDYLILRTAWLYSSFASNFVKTMHRLLSERTELGVVFDQVGTPTWAGDLADFLYHLVEGGRPQQRGIYHFTNEGVCSWYDLAEAIRLHLGSSCHLRPIRSAEYPTPAQRPAYSVLDKARLKADFGLQLPHWQTSLERCLAQISSSK